MNLIDHTLSGESMVTKVLGKINGRLKFLYRKQSFLNFSLPRMLCNALMQPHFDYSATAWYPNLNRKFSKKVQIAQNKCIRFCLSLANRTHIGIDEFCQNLSPAYMSDIFSTLSTTHGNSNLGQQGLSYIGPKFLNILSSKK